MSLACRVVLVEKSWHMNNHISSITFLSAYRHIIYVLFSVHKMNALSVERDYTTSSNF
jgi:hypothetical protein